MARPKKQKPNRADGRYEVKAVIGKNIDGTPMRKSFYSTISKKDAQRQADEYTIESEVAARMGQPFIPKDVTFKKWALEWLETYKKGNVKEHTYNFTYKSNVEKYLIPYFGKYSLKDIKQVSVQNYFKKTNHLAQSTLSKQKMILHDIFDKAIYNDLCTKNPVMDIKLPPSEPKERPVWNKEQADKAIEYCMNHEGGEGIIIMLYTGIRRSELIGLKWKDIDFEKHTVRIERAVVPTTGKIVEGKTKTEKSNRTIPVSDACIKFLSSMERPSEYVMSKTPKEPLNPNCFSVRFKSYMEKLCNEISVPQLTPHELRHTYGTILRENGVDLYTIQKVMGHANISITASIYVHNDIDVLRKRLGL